MPCSGAWRFPADRWWKLSGCVDAVGQFRGIGNDAQYFVSIDGPTPESTEAGIDFLAADAAPGSAKAGEDAIALEMFRGIRRGGCTPGASATSGFRPEDALPLSKATRDCEFCLVELAVIEERH